MATLLQTSRSKEVYYSTVHALGIIGTPSAIQALIEHYHHPEDILYALQTNEDTIISMLDTTQSPDTIIAAIAATQLLGFDSFIIPLISIHNEFPNKEVQESAGAALAQIRENPKQNNPKYREF